MACRVGISSNPDERKRYWEKEHSRLSNWKILVRGLSYSAAQKRETEYAKQYGCQAHPGGSDNNKRNWSVYRFDY